MQGSRVRAVLVGIVAVIVGYAGQGHGRFVYLERLTTDQIAPIEPSAPVEVDVEPARRVWVLFVDGLGADHVSTMVHLSALASEGVSRVMVADFPSMTYAGATTMATGVPPLNSGIRLNDESPWAPLDSVSMRAGAAGIEVAIDPEILPSFEALMRPPEGHRVLGLEAGLGERGEGRQLWWVYFGEVDADGHQYGGDSDDYRAAVQRADKVVGRMRAAMDPERDALVVVSDHGHLDRGGHGGVEPESLRAVFVAFGGPFVGGDGSLEPAPMRDLAPTLSAALGVAPPRSSMGVPMLDAFGLGPPRDTAPLREAAARERTAFVERAQVRLWVWGILCLLWLVVAIGLHLRGVVALEARDLVPTLVYTVVFCVGYVVLGYRMSLSIPRGEAGFIIELSLLGVVAVALALWPARRARRVEEAWVMALCFGVPYVLVAAWVGVDMSQLASPLETYAMLFMATIVFYGGIYFGFRAMVRPEDPARSESGA